MTANALLTVALTLWLEARGEGEIGMRAVATVIHNRAGGDVSKLEYVCTRPRQFSCWNRLSPTYYRKHPPSGEPWHQALEIAAEMFNGTFEARANWDHYYNPDMANPKWARGRSGDRVGNHLFLKVGT